MSDTARVATNMRALLLLEAVSRSDAPMTPTALARKMGLPKQTVHRVCHTLVENGFLHRDMTSRALRPGPRLRELASGALENSRFQTVRHQILRRVAAEVRETVNFVVPEPDGMRYLDRVETDWPFRVQLPIGTNVPFHCTASGKVYLASLPAGLRAKMLKSLPLDRHTPGTIIDREALAGQLETIASQGFATDEEEFMEGMVAMAVPIRDAAGRYIASLAFHGPTMRLDIALALSRKDVLFEAASDLSDLLSEGD